MICTCRKFRSLKDVLGVFNAGKINSTASALGKILLKSYSTVSDEPSDFEIQQSQRHLTTNPIPPALYGGRHTVTMIPGAGAGPELMAHVKHVFNVTGTPVDFETIEVHETGDNTELDYAITSIRRNGVGIKGNIETTSPAVRPRNAAIRTDLDLYVYVMHCKSFTNIPAKHDNVDIVLIRQNTEGEYSSLEHSGVRGMVETLKIVNRPNAERIIRHAFEYAKKHNRKKVTCVHKANIMKLSDGLFLQISREIGERYPDIVCDDMIIDNCCMQLVSNPRRFDVMVTTNLYGTIIANVICGLTGGSGLFSCKNHGDHYAVFEPGTRHCGRRIAKKNIANPVSMLGASVEMLYHLGHKQHAKRLKTAIYRTICEDQIHTPDLGGNATSTDIVQRILEHVRMLRV